MTQVFNKPLPPHWTTEKGAEMANRYLGMRRDQLVMDSITDFALANAVYLVGRNDLELLQLQTAAKERIRWLSAQLAMAHVSLRSIADLGKDGEHSGDRHAACRRIARTELERSE